MILSLGIDPDVHGCAFGIIFIDDDGAQYASAFVVRQKELTSRDAAIALVQQKAFRNAVLLEGEKIDVLTVEGQDVRYTGKTSYANPQDVCNLTLITGAALALSEATVKYSPLPREWKGTVPKDIKQKRILDGLGIKYEMQGGKKPYPVPLDRHKYEIGKVNASDWADLTDALGLAVWGLEKFIKTQCR